MLLHDTARGLIPSRNLALGSDHADETDGRGEIRLTDVSAGYDGKVVLREVTLEVARGDFVCVEGPSGAGKTTLLRVLHGSLKPLHGSAIVDGVDVTRLPVRHVSRLRRRLGCVFQNYELLAHLTALENVMLPLQLARFDLGSERERAEQALEMVQLADEAQSPPDELSGGQQQRVAIARAIAHEPRILLADEPTGNLDPDCTAEVMRAFEAYHDQGGTVVMATHDERLRDEHARRVLRIEPTAA